MDYEINGSVIWYHGDYYLYTLYNSPNYLLYICGGNPIEGTLQEIREYLEDQYREYASEELINFPTIQIDNFDEGEDVDEDDYYSLALNAGGAHAIKDE